MIFESYTTVYASQIISQKVKKILAHLGTDRERSGFIYNKTMSKCIRIGNTPMPSRLTA